MTHFIPSNKQVVKKRRTVRDSGMISVFLDETHCRFQASASMLMRSALFWDITRRRVVTTDVSGQRVKSEVGTDTLSRNVGKQLPHNAA
jgi:hypothetical protein